MHADYVIVGGGTAGCVLANRLSADPAIDVVVLEAGSEARSPWIAMPAGIAKLYSHPRLNWRYRTEPEPQLDGRSLYWPRGKVLGGTSSINGMTFVRGQSADYDAWSAIAGPGWAWQNVLPYFRRLETSGLGPDPLRGSDGPMRITAIAAPHPVSQAFMRSALRVGWKENTDYNGLSQEGIGFTQVMMHEGRRISAESAYLQPARSRANLHVMTGASVRRIVIEHGRATGVEIDRGGRRETIGARREVLLCAGTVASPQLLMLSGIGAASVLAGVGIPMVLDQPAVGQNLQEHVRAQLVYRTKVPTLNSEARGLRLLAHVVRYAWRRRGLLAVTASQVNGFVRSSPEVALPDLQLVFRPSSGDYRDGAFRIHAFEGVMAMAGLLRPLSRGCIALRSADPRVPPSIVTGHLREDADARTLIRGIRLLRRIFAVAPLADMIDGELRPGAGVENDAELHRYLRASADSLYHAVGTCAMGLGSGAVTTPELRVRGIAALRVVDASVMPRVPSGNTAAAVLMIAEKAADLIAGRSAGEQDAKAAITPPAPSR